MGFETIDVVIGMDDIDSPRGGCTTHFASLVVGELNMMSVQWKDYPNLVRLNPNIPFRTRGNGAVALRFSIREDKTTRLIPLISEMTSQYIEHGYPNTNPGVVVVQGGIPHRVKWFSQQATWRAMSLEIAKRLLRNEEIDYFTSGNGRGVIGALSAIGNTLDEDYTYEYIAYRPVESSAEPRGVSLESVRKVDENFGDVTFSNIDYETGYVLVEPHGPDPVLFGIRGESPMVLGEAAKSITSKQPTERWMIFRTNQATGEHLKHRVNICDLRPYMSARVQCRVQKKPTIIEGGHVIFQVADDSGVIDCAAYEPTGNFREIVRQLIPGDELILHAGVRPSSRTHGMTLNVEGMEIINLAEKSRFFNPLCPKCGKRLKSAGRNKGYKCEKCGFRSQDMSKKKTILERKIQPGLYLPPPRAQRHLTRPKSRMGKSNNGFTDDLIGKWHSF
jgi:tRNA(Ile2)-agmatinylcytidine synthase